MLLSVRERELVAAEAEQIRPGAGATRSPTVAPGAAKHWPQLGLDDAADFTTTEAIAVITGGNFRLTSRPATQLERILEINQMTTVTKEVVDAARESLVIGIL